MHPFAVQNTYGGPHGLQRLVDAAHARGLAVVLDVVYNHLGPEGNYFAEFGHYFTERHSTPWGRAINFDDRGSDEVRRFFIENALYWIDQLHIDALRLDAVNHLEILHLRFTDSVAGIRGDNANSVLIRDCTFKDNNTGIDLLFGSGLTVRNCLIRDNAGEFGGGRPATALLHGRFTDSAKRAAHLCITVKRRSPASQRVL